MESCRGGKKANLDYFRTNSSFTRAVIIVEKFYTLVYIYLHMHTFLKMEYKILCTQSTQYFGLDLFFSLKTRLYLLDSVLIR